MTGHRFQRRRLPGTRSRTTDLSSLLEIVLDEEEVEEGRIDCVECVLMLSSRRPTTSWHKPMVCVSLPFLISASFESGPVT